MHYLMLISAILASGSQILLKSSAVATHGSAVKELLNFKVMLAYFLLFLSMFLNIVAFQKVNYKWGPIIASSSYVFILVLSKLIFKEKFTKSKLIGMAFILSGILLFGL